MKTISKTVTMLVCEQCGSEQAYEAQCTSCGTNICRQCAIAIRAFVSVTPGFKGRSFVTVRDLAIWGDDKKTTRFSATYCVACANKCVKALIESGLVASVEENFYAVMD